ncbi:sensor histidine kinase [Zongyangia hominis]|uniref:histidine kinase n=1 Tax=Zongyangia hominis TaxID=2763677 RepID=A0A926EEH6_9FIRM|nr:HAMP domain-containing sensor histidine kinase [Zongyangia hominis]MBC8570416.1 HAMP domain-containing histidine kinase [Zongyangia hominis]
MQRSVFTRYFTVCAIIILMSVTILGGVFLMFASQNFRNEKLDMLYQNATHAADITMSNYESNGYQFISQSAILQGFQMMGEAIGAEFFLTDLNGKTLVCTEEDACQHANYLMAESIMTQLRAGNSYTEVGKLGGIYQSQYYTVAVPLLADTQVVGAIFVSTSAQSLHAFLMTTLKMFVVSALAVLIIAFVIIYFVTKRMTQPLAQMSQATRSFAKGDFTARVPVAGYDEIAQLAIAFNNMANSLALTESTRRSFVANVSHELKTPMTTIGGFVDGILDGTIPEEKHKYYLRIVSDEVKRLSRMVRSMLNISRIEAGETTINATDFDINAVICQTVFNLEQQIEAKHVDVRGLDSPRILVSADEDLIYQVVYNLIDNAVKFVNEGGYIELSYEVAGSLTYIAVRNSGAGIPKEEIPHVFDRFYKSDRSRGLDKNGVGLGLHIVRSIINLHAGDILVRSVEGEYSEFVFSLPTGSAAKFKKNEPKEK